MANLSQSSLRNGVFTWLPFALFIFAAPAQPQAVKPDSLAQLSPLELAEFPDDEFVPVPRAGRPSSPAYRFSATNIFTIQVNVNDFGENIIGDAANEPSLTVDPTDPSRMAIGWRQFDTITSNFRQAGYGYSEDGGQTWRFPGVIEPGVFRSDPVLDADSQGNFYYNSLTSVGSDFFCHVFKSSDGGATWDAGTFAYGGDKQWMVIDKTGGPGEGNIYAFWKQSFSICAPGFFTRSSNGNASYENCVTLPDDLIRGTLAVGPEGELYACGQLQDGFAVAKSFNARDSNQVVSWDFSTAVDLGGTLGDRAGPNPAGILGQVWVAVDQSSGPMRGYVYLLAPVKRSSPADPVDIMFARSTDGGMTWSAPVRINDDLSNNAWQWFGTIAVAPNGRIDVTWLDTRDDPGGLASALYYSFSSDGGLNWSANERLSDSFDPHVGWPQQNKIGDYFDMISDDAGAHLAWAGTFNGEQDIYYSRISLPVVAIRDRKSEPGMAGSFALEQNYPNPFNPSTVISYAIEKRDFVQIKILNGLGELVRILVHEEKTPGRYAVTWEGRNDLGEFVSSGAYFYTLTAGDHDLISKRMILLK